MPGLSTTLQTSSLVWREVDDGERDVIEAFIAAAYRHQHGALIEYFAPRLFGLWEGDRLEAAVGVRRADDTPLFLESYLPVPIEVALSQALSSPVERHDLAEISNLATRRPGLAMPLIRALISSLVAEECRWLAFTATAAVRNGFRRLDLDVRRLADADPDHLGAARSSWGNYYLHRPWVMGGDLLAAWHRLSMMSTPVLSCTVSVESLRNKGEHHA